MKTLITTLTAATLTAATILAAIPTGAAAEEPAATSSPRAPSRPRPVCTAAPGGRRCGRRSSARASWSAEPPGRWEQVLRGAGLVAAGP